jgi:type IV secretion system protein TrbC
MKKLAFFILFLLITNSALATPTASGGTTVLPWEGPLIAIYNSIKGPVALSIGGIGFVLAGAVLLFGGDIPEFGRRMCYLALVVGVVVSATGILSSLFSAGALVL